MSRVYALSIKQPWAALLVHGLKTIEIRRWSTARRGRILIHAARIPDSRKQGWKLVTPDIQPTTKLRGGIIGAGELIDCIRYRSPESFQGDQEHHRNDPDWFLPPCLYGFQFANTELLPFRHFPGNVRFFTVPIEAMDDA
jgi:hypothetical protein